MRIEKYIQELGATLEKVLFNKHVHGDCMLAANNCMCPTVFSHYQITRYIRNISTRPKWARTMFVFVLSGYCQPSWILKYDANTRAN